MARLRRVHIENFRCLRSVNLEFEPLTILVGPNASGKTAVLDALEPKLGCSIENVWRRDKTQHVHRWEVFGGSDEVRRSAAPGGTLDSTWRYLRLQLMPSALRNPNQVAHQPSLERSGGNLANVFGSLPRTTQGRVAEQLCSLVPFYSDVDVRPSSAGQHRVVFQDKWNTTIWYEPFQVSDGTMVLLAFLTLAHLREPPDILAIEEPEYALHPYLVSEVIGMLRKLAVGELGGAPVQVILATHSAELLNFAHPSEVRFLSRSLDDGSTVVRQAPTDDAAWDTALAEYQGSLGELWLSGGLGGVPDTTAAQ